MALVYRALTMPWTSKQRVLFHAKASRGEPGFKKLAKEADAWASIGRERPPVHEEAEPEEHEPWKSLKGEK